MVGWRKLEVISTSRFFLELFGNTKDTKTQGHKYAKPKTQGLKETKTQGQKDTEQFIISTSSVFVWNKITNANKEERVISNL